MIDEIAPKRGPGRPRKVVHTMGSTITLDPDGLVPLEPLAEKRTHVTMKRDPAHYAAPHTANVHVDEVANWAPYGWELAD